MTKTSIIGYDARELWLDSKSQWDNDRRKSYLLRHDVIKPLSVDKYVWYSVFYEGTQPSIWQGISLKQDYMTTQWSDTFAANRKLIHPDIYKPRGAWASLDSLVGHLNSNWKDNWKPCAIIAIEEILNDGEDEGDSVTIEPNAIDSNWELLGYDVADYELYTGLCEGVLNADLLKQVKPKWTDNLNEYHLFRNSEIALEYVDFANMRNPTHRPFYVYGLYLVETKRVNSFP